MVYGYRSQFIASSEILHFIRTLRFCKIHFLHAFNFLPSRPIRNSSMTAMPETRVLSWTTIPRDLAAGVVVFVVALPLCLGIALASNAPLLSGIISGVVGGIVVGLLSGSHTSVSGPGNTLMVIIAAQITALGSLEALLLAVVIAGGMQIAFGLARTGFLSEFFPISVIKGLLASIGILLVLKQIPHLLGHDAVPEGDMSFEQPDLENTFSEFGATIADVHVGAATIGIGSLLLLFLWERSSRLKRLPIPASLAVVLLGVATSEIFRAIGGVWRIGRKHLVQVPVAADFASFFESFAHPDFTQWMNPAVYMAAAMIALAASLETLLNIEAVDKIDPKQRTSPSNRELIAQGVGNIVAGLCGGIPVTSVIVRSSVNLNAGGQTKLATIVHGFLLFFCVMLLPDCLNLIPLSCLAAVLFVSGIKLASPQLFRQMWNDGRYQFAPFLATVVAIVLTDLLVGVLIGLGVSVGFILNSNLRRPIRRFVEKHLGGNVLHIELANQVSFLNRAALDKVLDGIPRGGHLLLDAQNTDYIDPDVLDLIRHYKEVKAPARGVEVSLLGFRAKYKLEDQIQYVDYSTRELQASMTPAQVLQILKDGHERFRTGRRLTRNLVRQVNATAQGQHPLAVVHSCMDSRASAELVFDAGVGDLFSVRVAGNVVSPKVLGSLEYACAVAGAKLVLVMGHTRCGAVTTAVRLACSTQSVALATGCQHAEHILQDIQGVVDVDACRHLDRRSPQEQEAFVDEAARLNVLRSVALIQSQSETLGRLVREGRIAVVGAMYDVASGGITFLNGDDADRESDLQVAESSD